MVFDVMRRPLAASVTQPGEVYDSFDAPKDSMKILVKALRATDRKHWYFLRESTGINLEDQARFW